MIIYFGTNSHRLQIDVKQDPYALGDLSQEIRASCAHNADEAKRRRQEKDTRHRGYYDIPVRIERTP